MKTAGKLVKFTGHVVSHTHWDREWYKTFERFRFDLVCLVDDLLEILNTKDNFRHFMLDGQAIILEDYLQIRPERRKELARHIGKGRISVGPWYVLPDEFLVSGESIVRNLAIGLEISQSFGGGMKVGYLPDQFGHIAQLPQILTGMGIQNSVLWRGITDRELPSEFWWQSPDGAKVLVHFLTIDMGYLNALRLPREYARARQRLLDAAVKRRKNAATAHLLLMNGVDHAPADGHVGDVIAGLNRECGATVFVHDSLEDYFEMVRRDLPRLPVRRGEFRETAKDGAISWVVPGVLSARMPDKILNHSTQWLLEKWAEPLAVFAWLDGGEYPEAFLKQAWKYLLQYHPHDTVAGCSADPVHADARLRLRWSREIAGETIKSSLKSITGVREIAAPERSRSQTLTLFNPMPWERAETVFCNIEMPVDPATGGFVVLDSNGAEVPFQIVGRRDGLALPEFNNGKYRIVNVAAAFIADKIPPCGYKKYRVRFTGGFVRQPGFMLAGSRSIENERFKVVVAGNGTLTVKDKAAGIVINGLNYFEDRGDAGDLYSFSKPARDKLFSTLKSRPRVKIMHAGPVFAEIAIEHDFRLPESLNAKRSARSVRMVRNRIVSRVRLSRSSGRVDVATEIENNSRDHRLRVCFPSGIRAAVSRAEGHFDVVERPIKRPDTTGWIESDPGTRPQQTFVDLSDGKRGLALLNCGMPEYEVFADPARTVALTLLRCVGFLQRNDLASRKDPAGLPLSIAVPDAQCAGKHVFKYSIYPHKGGHIKGGVIVEAYDFNSPIMSFQSPDSRSEAPDSRSFISTDSSRIILSCLKKADKSGMAVLRLVNMSVEPTVCRVSVGFPVASAFDADLLEKAGKPLRIGSNGVLKLAFRPKEIKTILVQPTGEQN